MNHSFKRIAIFACMLSSALSSMTHAAETSTLAQLDRPSGVFDNPVNEYLVNPAGPVTHHIEDAYGSADTFAQAGYGVVKTSATATGSSDGFGRFYARSGASFTDELTFSARGLDGEAGFFVVDLAYSRTLSAGGTMVDGYAADDLHLGTNFFAYDYMEVLQLQPSGCAPGAESPCSPGTSESTLNGADAATWLAPNLVSVRVPIVFGRQETVTLSLNATALASYYLGASTWTSDAAHSLYWGGITGVTDADGNAIDYGLSASSGTDYLRSFAPTAVPVPEPSIALLLGVGGLCLKLAAARRRRYRLE